MISASGPPDSSKAESALMTLEGVCVETDGAWLVAGDGLFGVVGGGEE